MDKPKTHYITSYAEAVKGGMFDPDVKHEDTIEGEIERINSLDKPISEVGTVNQKEYVQRKYKLAVVTELEKRGINTRPESIENNGAIEAAVDQAIQATRDEFAQRLDDLPRDFISEEDGGGQMIAEHYIQELIDKYSTKEET